MGACPARTWESISRSQGGSQSGRPFAFFFCFGKSMGPDGTGSRIDGKSFLFVIKSKFSKFLKLVGFDLRVLAHGTNYAINDANCRNLLYFEVSWVYL